MNGADSGDDNSYSYVLEAYYRLLADVVDQSGVHMDVPDKIDHSWVLKRGPELDKKILMFLEHEAHFTPSFWRDDHAHLVPDHLKYGEIYLDIMSNIPEWLTPLWEKFLERGSSFILRLLRTVLLFCYKVEHEATNEQIQAAQAAFEENDSGCRVWGEHFVKCLASDGIYRIARNTVSAVIHRINWSEIRPKHGPGGIFPTRASWLKSNFRTSYTSIVEKYPFDQYYCGIPTYWYDVMVRRTERWPISEIGSIVANLIAVPKDSRGPRLICVHPAESVWIQLGQAEKLEAYIEASPLTRGKIKFTDQTVNANMALLSSLSQRFVTLDLKEASDRISWKLVCHLFGDYAYDWLSCARATNIKLPDGRVIEAQKWAPMGNGLTFPVQSLVFWAIVHAGIRSMYGKHCTEIYVFGDDIIFPSSYMDGAIRALVMSGLVPNQNKTFAKGFFRESCGTDAFKGISVTPLRMKKARLTSIESVVSTLDLAKRLRLAGYSRCSSFLYETCRWYLARRRYRVYYPSKDGRFTTSNKFVERALKLAITNDPDCSGLVEYRNISTGELHKCNHLHYSERLHKYVVRCTLVRGLTMRPPVHDWYHVQDSLLALSRKGEAISDRGTEYAIPYRTQLMYGWTDCLLR